MATITINIPDDKAADIRDAFAVKYGWTADLGITKTAFAKKIVAEFVKGIYQSYVIDNAAEQARLSAKSSISNIDIN
jgi:hypothetical protein